MPALTHAEAVTRAALLEVLSYDVFLDLTAGPVVSRTEVRFRCRTPGAETFADVTMPAVRSAILNGEPLGPPDDGRLRLSSLAAENVLTVEGEVASGSVSRFDYAGGETYLHAMGFPSVAGELMACFDQPDLGALVTVSLRAPAGWECYAHSAVTERPPADAAGLWRFEPVPDFEPHLLVICSGPFVTDVEGTAGDGCGCASGGVDR
jgi:aminopeptidase N